MCSCEAALAAKRAKIAMNRKSDIGTHARERGDALQLPHQIGDGAASAPRRPDPASSNASVSESTAPLGMSATRRIAAARINARLVLTSFPRNSGEA